MSQWMIQQVSRRMLHWQPLRNVRLIKESLEVYNIYLGCCEERRLCGRSWLCTGQWAPVCDVDQSQVGLRDSFGLSDQVALV